MNTKREPVTVAYGAGVDSTAMIVELVRLGEPLDLILFADTGGELPETYAYLAIMNTWLRSKGYPEIVTVYPKNAKGETIQIETESLRLGTLPSLAFGFHTCSHRFKIVPQEKFINAWQPAIDAWSAGQRVVKLIGFECGEESRTFRFPENPKYRPRFPLQEWGWNRARCLQAIAEAGLPSPGKSACFFCPARKKFEIAQLAKSHPALAARAVEMETRAIKSGKLAGTPAFAAIHPDKVKRDAKGRQKGTKGLGRSFAWSDFLKSSV